MFELFCSLMCIIYTVSVIYIFPIQFFKKAVIFKQSEESTSIIKGVDPN